MKKKMIIVEIVLLLAMGAYAIYMNWAKQPKRVEFDDIISEIYFGDTADVIAEMSFTIDDARKWDLPGLSDDILDRFEEHEVKLDPTQQMKMTYASLHGTEMLVYYTEFVRRDAVLGDYAWVHVGPMDLTFDEIIGTLIDEEYQEIASALEDGLFFIEHAHTTSLITISTEMSAFIKDEMSDVLFFHLETEDTIVFVYDGELYVVVLQNGDYEITYPESITFHEWISGQS